MFSMKTLLGDPNGHETFCEDMLPRVSRTFAINIRILPRTMRRAVGTAYLLCRIADTLEDSTDLNPQRKQALLAYFRTILPNSKDWERASGDFSAQFDLKDPHKADITLAQNLPRVMAVFHRLPPSFQHRIWPWVDEMCRGMSTYVTKTEVIGRTGAPLLSEKDLDTYCYFVAGTVGYMLTELFTQFSPHIRAPLHGRLMALANSCGLSLQLTNIIKDLREDADRGIFYLPESYLKQAGLLGPSELFDPAKQTQGVQVVHMALAKAWTHLDDALEYTLHLPRLEPRIRLFCVWPFFLAARTLAHISRDPARVLVGKVKVPRKELLRIFAATAIASPSNLLLTRMYERERNLVPAGI